MHGIIKLQKNQRELQLQRTAFKILRYRDKAKPALGYNAGFGLDAGLPGGGVISLWVF